MWGGSFHPHSLPLAPGVRSHVSPHSSGHLQRVCVCVCDRNLSMGYTANNSAAR